MGGGESTPSLVAVVWEGARQRPTLLRYFPLPHLRSLLELHRQLPRGAVHPHIAGPAIHKQVAGPSIRAPQHALDAIRAGHEIADASVQRVESRLSGVCLPYMHGSLLPWQRAIASECIELVDEVAADKHQMCIAVSVWLQREIGRSDNLPSTHGA